MANENNSSAETLKFIKNDFGQCFQQMRHYDNKMLNIAYSDETGH
jgi:hypothetical protein